MLKKDIDSIAYLIQQAYSDKAKPKPIVLLGAGASISAGIPGAQKIMNDIFERYKNKPEVKKLQGSDKEKNYYSSMACLNTNERHSLLREYISDESVRINVTHIYLAQLLKKGYIDYILTVNFDDLLLRASALFNFIPPVYDVSIIKDFTTTNFQEGSVIYLHGQHHGLWLLNTEDELGKVKSSVPKILHKICHGRTWIIIGYSGEDEILNHIAELGRFDNELFWVGYNNEEPIKKVKENLLSKSNTDAHWIAGYDADSFFLKLHAELKLDTPEIFNKPFSFLDGVMNNVKDIEESKGITDEHKAMFKHVGERFTASKRQVKDAVYKYEEGKSGGEQLDEEQINIDLLRQEIIEAIVKEQYDVADRLYEESRKVKSAEIDILLSGLYNNWAIELSTIGEFHQSFTKYQQASQLDSNNANTLYNWGTSLADLAQIKNNEDLFVQSFEKYQQAAQLNPNNASIFNNWGIALTNLARIRSNEHLFIQSFEKYQQAAQLNPNDATTFNNWATSLTDLAKIKSNEDLFNQSFTKHQQAAQLNPNDASIFNNWGAALTNLARIKNDEGIFIQSFTKYQQASQLNPNDATIFNNWGTALVDLARIKSDEDLFIQSFTKYQQASQLNPNDATIFNNWGTSLADLAKIKSDEDLFIQSFTKYQQASQLKPNDASIFKNWGTALVDLARIKNDEDILTQSFIKYQQASQLNPNDATIFNNWGTSLVDLAKIKSDEDLFIQSFTKYQQASQLNPNDARIFKNWGAAFADLAKIKSDEGLFIQSFEKYQQASQLNPNDATIFNNWGIALTNLAQIKSDEGLFIQSFEKYRIAVVIEPNNAEIYFNWCGALISYAQIIHHGSKEKHIVEAKEKGEKAVELGGKHYNLACCYALLQDKEQALYYLEKSLSGKEVHPDTVQRDQDWKEYQEDTDFQKLIEQFKETLSSDT